MEVLDRRSLNTSCMALRFRFCLLETDINMYTQGRRRKIPATSCRKTMSSVGSKGHRLCIPWKLLLLLLSRLYNARFRKSITVLCA